MREEPISEEDKKFTKWQERVTRKDIERAFGVVLQCCKFKAVACPLYFMDL
jgi:hypothetical protein